MKLILPHKRRHWIMGVIGWLLIIGLLIGTVGCRANRWPVSTPDDLGLDGEVVAKMVAQANEFTSIHSLLIVKDGHLVVEEYFNGGSVNQRHGIQSVTKSVMSALVGIALAQGDLPDLEQHMMDYFPEYVDVINDERKLDITLQQLLQMRAGYLTEYASEELLTILHSGFRTEMMAEFPMAYDPGKAFQYSNMTSHIMGMILERATGQKLLPYGRKHLFRPLGIRPARWTKDWDGNTLGYAELHISAREMAQFGQLYLDGGVYHDRQIIPAEWVEASLMDHSQYIPTRVGRNFNKVGYGYQWWSVESGNYRYHLAWGHGGQQIAIIDELDMVIATTADPQYDQEGGEAWAREAEILNLVADYIATLP